MFSRMRRRFTYTNMAVTVALVFAMTGGAYAASKYVVTSTKQISPKVLAALKGKNGKNGSSGPAGPAGTAGAVGPAGAKGETGAAGKEGPKGEPGAPGQNGKDGSPWTAGSTLPSGKTESGTWSGSIQPSKTVAVAFGSISFVIPPASAPTPHIILFGEEGEGKGSGCPTHSSVTKPEAEPGNLCVYVGATFNTKVLGVMNPEVFGLTPETPEKSGKTGALVEMNYSENEGLGLAYGTWAVTGQ